ncbi:hypothetical protein EYR41_006343 [Orbilia oligospora]|uniref:Uncharacterized protein n=1 Tax=Orbilia oligospora TaxID=2813651 RepID=A0A8H2E4M2_ORBOL|nr:hypothetical protein EYR41_006343 [Orbilia oligospora]
MKVLTSSTTLKFHEVCVVALDRPRTPAGVIASNSSIYINCHHEKTYGVHKCGSSIDSHQAPPERPLDKYINVHGKYREA